MKISAKSVIQDFTPIEITITLNERVDLLNWIALLDVPNNNNCHAPTLNLVRRLKLATNYKEGETNVF